MIEMSVEASDRSSRLLRFPSTPAGRVEAGLRRRRQPRHVAGLASDLFASGLILLASASPALAHILEGEAQGLVTGFLHPISGLDHVLAMISVGLWGAQLGSPARWLLPV